MFDFVDIETTSYCNAKCPFCNRTNMKFEKKHLDLEVIKKLPFNEIKNVLLIGNKGDAIFYNKFFELIEYIINNFDCHISLHTNASAHNTDWWIKLHKITQERCRVVYALDGLEDTHSLYRIGTNFHKVVENIEAYNKAGGYSICQFIRFQHNDHQIDGVRKLVSEIGSKKIWVRKSRGYNRNLKRPSNTKTRHEINRMKGGKICCVFLERPSFVLTVDGEIRPCCFMADDNYFKDFLLHLKLDIRNCGHIIKYRENPNSINLYKNSFEDIMLSEYFELIRKNYRRLHKCNQKCIANFSDIVDEEEL